MRTVKFNRWTPIEYKTVEDGGVSRKTKVEGTGSYQKDFPNIGTFHHWGVGYEEFEQGIGNYTVAIIENLDGTIEVIHPGDVKFID